MKFQQLLDDTRSELAYQYLADPRRSLAEVADQLGFQLTRATCSGPASAGSACHQASTASSCCSLPRPNLPGRSSVALAVAVLAAPTLPWPCGCGASGLRENPADHPTADSDARPDLASPGTDRFAALGPNFLTQLRLTSALAPLGRDQPRRGATVGAG